MGTARGSFLRRWRLLAIDGFELDVPDTEANAAEFGYAGSGDNRSAFPKARVVALAECGTHAFVAAEVDAYRVGEKTLASRLYPRLRADELLTADRGFYSWPAWDSAAATGAALLWRAPTQLALPVVAVLGDGTYLSALIKPSIRGCRHDRIIAAARRGEDLTELAGNASPASTRGCSPIGNGSPPSGEQDDRSPVTGDCHAGICGSPGVKFPRATRPPSSVRETLKRPGFGAHLSLCAWPGWPCR